MNKRCDFYSICMFLFLAFSTSRPMPIKEEAPQYDRAHAYRYETNFLTPHDDIDELANLKWSVEHTTSALRYMLSVPISDVDDDDDGGDHEVGAEPEEYPALSGREWVAVGMSPYGASAGADMVIFIRGAHGEITVLDTYTDEYGVLSVDDQQDYKLGSAWIRRSNNETDLGDDGDGDDRSSRRRRELVIEYTRKIDTCDDKDYMVERGTTHMLFLRGPGPWPMNETVEASVHPYHHSLRRVTLLKSETPKPSFPADTKTIDIVVDDVQVPDDATTYWCKVSRFPDAEVKHHIVKYEVVVSEGNEDLVHHIEVYHCDVPADVEVPLYQGPCDERPVDSSSRACSQVIGAWAMGAEAFVYPNEAGIAVGGPTSSFIMIELHYNNPTRKSNIIDSSGLRFYYTPTLRPYDAGIMELGLVYTPKLSIPPGMDKFVLTGHCLPKCTRAGFPRSGVYAFASQLHTHLTGTAVWTKHVRNGRELPELNRDDHFSSDFQEIRMLPKPVHILPGDTLITSCNYVTSQKENMTMGGFGISDEMCVNYVHYYPRSALEVCKSTISKRVLRNFFYWAAGHGNGLSDEMTNEEVLMWFNSINWTQATKRLWQTIVARTNVDMDCFKPAGVPFRGNWHDLERGKIRQRLERPVRGCELTRDFD
ncbi:dopamine beta-hydroxylase-like [Diadema setosum]|uniref:dopamine beta-hydroxylase-like n=1 Tax=Diadema setosum TaxID=31175 RepID=UPI003B3B95C0